MAGAAVPRAAALPRWRRCMASGVRWSRNRGLSSVAESFKTRLRNQGGRKDKRRLRANPGFRRIMRLEKNTSEPEMAELILHLLALGETSKALNRLLGYACCGSTKRSRLARLLGRKPYLPSARRGLKSG